eukprot:SAG11_NODE_4447_length_1891_cov_3.422433_2_plen_223_part_00
MNTLLHSKLVISKVQEAFYYLQDQVRWTFRSKSSQGVLNFDSVQARNEVHGFQFASSGEADTFLHEIKSCIQRLAIKLDTGAQANPVGVGSASQPTALATATVSASPAPALAPALVVEGSKDIGEAVETKVEVEVEVEVDVELEAKGSKGKGSKGKGKGKGKEGKGKGKGKGKAPPPPPPPPVCHDVILLLVLSQHEQSCGAKSWAQPVEHVFSAYFTQEDL